jgi:hypothetical protein
MLAGAAGSINFEANAEMIRLDLSMIEEAPQQWILRSSNRMKGTGAVEAVAETHRLHRRGATAAIFDFDANPALPRGHDPARDDLEPPIGDHARNGSSDFRSNPMAMDVPPRARVPEEAALLIDAKALPQWVAVRPKTVDGRTPAHIGGAPPEPAPKGADGAGRNLLLFD